MRLSKKVLKKRFKKFNELYFNGELVEPQFQITGNRWIAGMCVSKLIIREDENGEDYISKMRHVRIQLSKYLIKNSRILDNILLHEMIHYYGYYISADMEGVHEDFFLSLAEEINKDGYNVQKYYKEY